MFTLLVILAVLAVLVAIPGVVGLRLPSDFESTGEVRLPLAPSAAWAAITDVTRFRMTRARKPVERLPDVAGLPCWREFPAGTGTSMLVETVELSPDTRLVRTMKDEIAPVSVRLELDISADGEGSRVKAVEKLRVEARGLRAPYFRFAMKLAGAGAGSRAYL